MLGFLYSSKSVRQCARARVCVCVCVVFAPPDLQAARAHHSRNLIRPFPALPKDAVDTAAEVGSMVQIV